MKGVTRIRKLKKDWQHNGKKIDLQNTLIKLKIE
jgi:hypothetical protein